MRLLTDDGVTASFGLAADEALANGAGDGASPPTLRLYTYRSHAALVGRFQTVESEVNLPFCAARGIAVNRRPTGGGAILMGADQLGIALVQPAGPQDSYGRARESMARFARGLVTALRELGIGAGFRRKNDLEVEGRKIAGLGMYRSPSGGLLFHASLLVDLDVPLMLEVLRTPYEKLADKGIGSVAARITSLRRLLGPGLSTDDARRAVARGYAGALGAELLPGDLSSAERTAIASLEATKYRTREWVFQEATLRDSQGSARLKTEAGLLDVRVALAGGVFKAVHIGGDFFAAETAVARLEAALRWCPSEPDAVGRALSELAGPLREEIGLGSLEGLRDAILLAADDARRPYGCFVSPGGGEGTGT